MSNSGKILQRFFKNAKYSDEEWDLLNQMLNDSEPWSVIHYRFNISKQYYKAIKNYFMQNGSIY